MKQGKHHGHIAAKKIHIRCPKSSHLQAFPTITILHHLRLSTQQSKQNSLGCSVSSLHCATNQGTEQPAASNIITALVTPSNFVLLLAIALPVKLKAFGVQLHTTIKSICIAQKMQIKCMSPRKTLEQKYFQTQMHQYLLARVLFHL